MAAEGLPRPRPPLRIINSSIDGVTVTHQVTATVTYALSGSLKRKMEVRPTKQPAPESNQAPIKPKKGHDLRAG